MTYKNLKSFKVKDYKCFIKENDYQGFDEIEPINIIIGKNNSGKSKILEFFKEFVRERSGEDKLKISDQIFIRKILQEGDFKQVERNIYTNFCKYFLNGNSPVSCDSAIEQHFSGKIAELSGIQGKILNHSIKLDKNGDRTEVFQEYEKNLLSNLNNPFFGYDCLHIQAERDLKKEEVDFNNGDATTITLGTDGAYLTNYIVRCLTEARGHVAGRKQLIEKTLLDKINSVLSPDINFTRIDTSIDSNQWEIYLEEKDKGGIKLSDCGSGIKTVIFVMVMLYVVPELKKDKKFIFMFEELENNLHPSLERRLLAHIRDYILAHPDYLLFITTHSNVAIDMFSKNENAQILQARNDGKGSFIEKVETWHDHHNLLNDLGVKASDVLQANCLIWLEGPSDKIYFNKWIQVFNDGKALEEDLHYQCVFYGGSNLAHHSADTETDEFIQMLKINRNAVVIMDRDKDSSDTDLKPNVQRIIRETADKTNVLSWVTEGREIENYLPKVVLDNYFDSDVTLGQYESFADKYKEIKNVQTFDKVGFASKITKADYYTLENLESHLNLKGQMETVIAHIRECNS
jgi:predicted ATP-dependent endonuclease of OLD family